MPLSFGTPISCPEQGWRGRIENLLDVAGNFVTELDQATYIGVCEVKGWPGHDRLGVDLTKHDVEIG